MYAHLLLFFVGLYHVAAGPEAGSSSGGSSSNLGTSSLELFRRSWLTYKKVVENDHMEHKSMTSELESALRKYVSGRGSTAIAIADVGCGDLGLLGPLYRSLAPSLTTFTGVDLSEPALDLAQQEMAALRSTVDLQWAHEDLLRWSSAAPTAEAAAAEVGVDGSLALPPSTATRYDVVICVFSVHHLHDTDKQVFLRNVLKHRLKEGGIVLMADIFLTPNETRDGFMQRFGSHVERTWTSLSAEQKGRYVIELNVSFFVFASDIHHCILPTWHQHSHTCVGQ